ncbi:MAG: ATP-binding protein [Sediminibacterium sp.]
MKRIAYQQLVDWKNSPSRKPLILRGARQVGKTWLMKEFGKNEFNQLVYINFEASKQLHSIFQQGFEIPRILLALSIETGINIQPENSLIVFDEIQACPAALTSLKYFQENAPQIAIIAAGSLLGVAMHANQSFPVGKVSFLDLYPMNFKEFLLANKQAGLVQLLETKDWEMMVSFKDKFITQLKQYYFIGGMPEVVSSFVQQNDFAIARTIQETILNAYEQDFSKHAPNQIVPRIRMVWQSITAQLAKENSKFLYSSLRTGARAKDFELALAWLGDAGLVHKVTRISKPNIPLSAYEDLNDFKLYLHDTGLLCAMGNIDAKTILQNNELFQEFKGALTEQFCLQQLKSLGIKLYYWTIPQSMAEVDFVIQLKDQVIPIEVKASENLMAKSLKIYATKFKPGTCWRFSLSDYRAEEWLTNIPLYAISQIETLVTN